MKRLHSLRALCCASLFALLPNVVNAQIQLPATSCEPADLPVLSTETTLLCAGSATTIQITSGTLNDAQQWVWREGSCDGTVVGTGLSLSVAPLVTTTYYVSGENGCTPGPCATLTLNVQPSVTYYADADGDGYGNPNISQSSCSPLEGFVTNNLDCNDLLASIRPGAPEILYNGIDENCNGQRDEGAQVTTNLLPAYCGVNLATVNAIIGIKTVSSAITKYRIRVTNGNQVMYLERGVPHFNMTMFDGYAYATTYSVAIELQRYGVWLGYYGPECTVTTPGYNNTFSIVSPSCGSVLPALSTIIATTNGAGVTAYRFRVTNLSEPLGPLAVQTSVRAINWFNLTMLTRYNYGTTYRVEVAVKTVGDFGAYGASCEFTTPAPPVLIHCGAVVSQATTLVAAQSVNGVVYYRFQILRDSDGAMATIDRNLNSFCFNNLPAYMKAAGETYFVRVSVMTTGYWSPFGEYCEITTPASFAKLDEADEGLLSEKGNASFKVFPNPFPDTFTLQQTASQDEMLLLQIFDANGRELQKLQSSGKNIGNQPLGAQLPSRSYHVLLTGDSTRQQINVIKK